MMRRATVLFRGVPAGTLSETDDGYAFAYSADYLARPDAAPIAFAFPLKTEIYRSGTLFPFFDGLIPEGWLLAVAEENWKLDARDRMGLLLACCRDCIGAVSVEAETEEAR